MKNTQTLFIICALLLISSFSIAQSNSDFQGTWNSTDKAGNLIELKLNSNATCSFKINGVTSYNITHYRLITSSKGVKSDADPSPNRDIWFYTNIAPSPYSGSGTLSPSNGTVSPLSGAPQAKVIYKGYASLTDVTFKELFLSFTPDVTKPPVSYTFSK